MAGGISIKRVHKNALLSFTAHQQVQRQLEYAGGGWRKRQKEIEREKSSNRVASVRQHWHKDQVVDQLQNSVP